VTPRVLVTGGTGFVGRQICSALADRDVPTTLVSRDKAISLDSNLRGVERVIVTSDLFAEPWKWWKQNLLDIDIVIHAAWYAEPGRYLQSAQNLSCLSGTMQLAMGCAGAGVKRFVGIGTCFEYDLTGGLLSVDTPLDPLTPYAAAKAATYSTLSRWFPTENISFCWCRLFYLHGENEDRRRFVPYLRSMLEAERPAELTRGDQIRDFLDVRKAGEMIVETALSQTDGPVNICSGVPVTIREFATKIASEYGRVDLLRFGVRPENQTDPPCVIGLRPESERQSDEKKLP